MTEERCYRVAMQMANGATTLTERTAATRFRVRIIDLGGDGALVLSPTRPVPEGDRVYLHLPPMNGYPKLDIPTRVSEVTEVQNGWKIEPQFMPITEPACDRIIYRVFSQEPRWLSRTATDTS